MIRALINLATVGRETPMPFLGEGTKPIAWVEIGGDSEVAIHGAPSEMRELAAAATCAADQADEMLRVAQLLTAAGMGERFAV
jgi:hypothetical protein